jgi:nitroreductase
MTSDFPPSGSFDGFLDLLTHRRSVRKFRPDPVDLALVEKVLAGVRFAPTPTNRQCFRFLAISDPLVLQTMRHDVLRRIDSISQKLDADAGTMFREYSKWFTFFDQAPLVIFGLFRVFASRLPVDESPDKERLEGLAEVQAFGGAVHALLLGLHALGLGSCWMSGPLIAENQLEQLLQVERPWRLGAVVPVGWPEAKGEAPHKPALEAIFSSFPLASAK